MLSDAEMLERMAKGWRGGLDDGTVCGNGSTLSATQNARKWLPGLVKRHGIRVVNDAGAGDLHWIAHIGWDIEYRGFDLVPRRDSIVSLDITRDVMPPADAILCRMVLNHLDEPRIMLALERFRQSAKFLIATQFNGEDLPQRSPQFTRLDLRKAPYSLGEPLEAVQDGREHICSLALWRL